MTPEELARKKFVEYVLQQVQTEAFKEKVEERTELYYEERSGAVGARASISFNIEFNAGALFSECRKIAPNDKA